MPILRKYYLYGNMRIRHVIYLLTIFVFALSSCQPKGPITFDSPFIGKSKNELVKVKGNPHKIQNFGSNIAYIYTRKEEYYGKVKNIENKDPKSIYSIEYIYYIDSKQIIYKYQVWKKKIKN